MNSNFGKWLAWLVGWFGILSKKWGSYWKNRVFADLPKKASEGEVRVKCWYLGCFLDQMTSNWKYTKYKDRRWHTEEMDSFFHPQITPKIDCYFKRLSKYACGSKWVFLVIRQKLPFFNKKLNFYIEYQKKRLVKPIICQNLRSFGQASTEILLFDPLGDSNEKR